MFVVRYKRVCEREREKKKTFKNNNCDNVIMTIKMLQPLLRHQKNDTTEISGKFLGNDDEIEEESEMSKGMIITKENGEDEDDFGKREERKFSETR